MELLILYGLLLTLPKIILDTLEINFLKTESQKKAYILEESKFKQAAYYAITKQKISLIEHCLDFMLVCFWISFGLAFLEQTLSLEGTLKDIVFVLIFLCVGSLASFITDAYKTLVVDKKFGFAKGGVGLFLTDSLKSFLLLIVFGGLIIFAFVWVMNHISYWEFYAFILGVCLIVGVNLLYPIVIAPLFNKFTPLENTELSSNINELLKKAGFHSKGVFVMDASRRDGRLNAYFGGIGKTKRVILFDTLLDKIPKNSLLAILGHELGHFKHKDIFKMMGLVLGFLALLFFIIANLPSSLFALANLTQNPHTTLVFLLILSTPIGFYFMLIINHISCQNEFNADAFGAELTSKEDLALALLKLIKENNTFPLAHPLYMRFYYSHPPLMARLVALNCENLAQNSPQEHSIPKGNE